MRTAIIVVPYYGRKAFGATVVRPSGVFRGLYGRILGLLFPVFRVLVTPGY